MGHPFFAKIDRGMRAGGPEAGARGAGAVGVGGCAWLRWPVAGLRCVSSARLRYARALLAAAGLPPGSDLFPSGVEVGGGRRRRRRGACPGRGGRRGLAFLRGLPLAESALRAAAAARPTAGHFQRIFGEMFGARHVRQQDAPRVPP